MARVSTGGVQSVERALSILGILADSPTDCALSEIVRESGLPAATVHRLLTALVHSGYVTQDPATSRYALGSLFILIGQRAVRNNELIRVARPWLEATAGQTGETVNLTARVADRVVQLDHVESRNMLRVSYAPGERFPLHASASGKLFLAHMPPAERDRILASTLEPFTPDTIVRRSTLLQELQTILQRGYSLDDAEREVGVRCIAAPIVNDQGDVCAAVSISGPTLRISVERLHRLAADLIETARAISLAWTGTRAQRVSPRMTATSPPQPVEVKGGRG
jgi:IclR family acetate operon transcriptional repressor